VAFGQGVNVMEAFNILPDPQTNGGLLIAVDPLSIDEVIDILTEHEVLYTTPIGKLVKQGEKIISVTN
jgi:selenide,water dikinase